MKSRRRFEVVFQNGKIVLSGKGLRNRLDAYNQVCDAQFGKKYGEVIAIREIRYAEV